MASSQVEITTSSPFGRFGQNNLNKLVHSCMPNDNKHIDLWVHRPQWQTTTGNNQSDPMTNSSRDMTTDNIAPIHNNNNRDKWARARQMVFSVDHGKGSSNESSVEVSNLRGVSSLVQKWRGFEAKRSTNRSNIITRTNVDNYVDPPTPAPSLNEDSYDSWESEPTFPSPSRDSERERLRVADIIKKLTDNEVGGESPPPISRVIRTTSSSDQSEGGKTKRCVSPIVNSPRIRGRQAFNDLLMQMEHDRRTELQGLVARRAVSKFSHRGRIQALLRFRFLRRGMEAKEDCYPTDKSSQAKKVVHPSSLHARESSKPSSHNYSNFRNGCCHKEFTNNNMSISFTTNQHENENRCNEDMRFPEERTTNPNHGLKGSIICSDSSHYKVKRKTQENAGLLRVYENPDHKMSSFSVFMKQETDLENSNQSLDLTSAENVTSEYNTEINDGKKTECNTESCCVQNKEEDNTIHEVMKRNLHTTGDCEESCGTSKQQLLESINSCMYWESDDVPNPEVGWENLQCDDDDNQQEGSNREWIDEVSRPRSDWEGMRQARYQEMLDPFLDNNEEIRALLGRKSVSTFLSSGLRDKIDRVMISHAQAPQTPKNDQRRKEDHESFHEQTVSTSPKQEDDEEVEQDEKEDYSSDNFYEYEEAAESSKGQQYNESDDYTDLITNSPPESWAQLNQGRDYSFQVASPSTQQSSSHYYSENAQPVSSDSAHPSLDMELIYDLRGHMEQLHREMSELKNSIKCCMDMQIKLQRSIKKEVATALYNSEAKTGRRNTAKKVASSEGMCCVCSKMKVDSLLYRCGHMCTCFKCAHKLHWSSGKCPVCKTPILDVVRIYSNNHS